MTTAHDHEPTQFYWAADTEYCPHEPEPERHTDAWDQWMCNHQTYDDGVLCLDAPAGIACPACSAEHGDIVTWDRCEGRDHNRPARGVIPNPDAGHQPVPIWVGSLECLERECEEYFTDDGDEKPGMEKCSHIREETACACQRLPGDEYSLEPCPATPPAV